MLVTAVVYDYGEQCFCACCPSQTETTIVIPPLQSSPFQERYVTAPFSLPLICWLTIFKGTLCLGKELSGKHQVPYSATV